MKSIKRDRYAVFSDENTIFKLTVIDKKKDRKNLEKKDGIKIESRKFNCQCERQDEVNAKREP